METLEQQIYSIQRPASWIRNNDFDITGEAKHPDSPYFYLLVDYQELIEDDAVHSFRRTVQKINDASRIEEAASYLKELHADSQSIILHSAHITTNLLTLSLSIDDLRVGDVLDFQLTLVERAGEHPLWVKHHMVTFWLDWVCLVLRQKIRIINRSTNSLNLHHHDIDDGKQTDDYRALKAQQEFTREYFDLVPKTIAGTAPDWLWSDFLQVTRKTSWQQISRYLYRYYTHAAALDGKFDMDIFDRIKLGGHRHNDALHIITLCTK